MLIHSTLKGIGNTDASKDPGFMNVKSTTVIFKNFKWQKTNLLKKYSYKKDSDWSSGKIESTLKEISLRATGMRQSLMP